MQPRTKEEIRVMELSVKLPPLSSAQREWAITHIGTPTAYVNKRHAWCSECGQPLNLSLSTRLVDILDDDQKTTVCPHCGKVLTVREKSLGSIHRDYYYYTLVTTCNGYQVFRHFFVVRYAQRTCEISFAINEAVQNWINSDGHETIVARDVAPTFFNDSWMFYRNMSIKHRCKSYYAVDRYDINPNYIYPNRKYIPTLKRNGFKGDFLDLTPAIVAKNILGNSDYEYLIKTNQISVFKHLCKRGADSIPHKYALNICNRNNYIIKDAVSWFDMVEALNYLGKDLRSPHFVCPSDLTAAHDKYIKLKNAKHNKELREQKLKEALRWEKEYYELKHKYFDLVISNDNIFIKVLRKPSEFVEEGEKMHHCVGSYYKYKDSLILSARDKDGNRIETIEVSLKTFKIIQSRGVCNSNTEFHDEILKLMNDNMNKIKYITANIKAAA